MDEPVTTPPPTPPTSLTEPAPGPVLPSPPKPGVLDRMPGWLAPLLLVGIPLLFAIAVAVQPALYSSVVWPDYWGPIHADAAGHAAECLQADGRITMGSFDANGDSHCTTGVLAHSGYNVVNTASWAVLLGLCILGTAQLLNRFKARMDGKLIVAATLWVVAGSLFHVLEDAQLMAAPLQYFFITPTIYLVFAALGVLSFVLGQYLRVVAERTSVAFALQKLWMWLAIPVLGYLVLALRQWNEVAYWFPPVAVALYALVPFVAASWRFNRIGRIDPSELVAFLSIGWILLGASDLLVFDAHPWSTYFAIGTPVPLRAALLAPVFAAALVALVAAIAWTQRARHPRGAAAYLAPMNLLLLFSQMLDAFATSMGIDLGGYREKHVLSAGVINAAKGIGDRLHLGLLSTYPTFLGFATLKLVVSLLVVYAIDVSNPEESRRYPTLIGLVKFAIIMVGIGPGIRDFVRMALGI